MAKTDWNLNDIVRPQDMNDIGEEINQLRTDVDNIQVPPASLTQPGIVQLSNSTNGTREDRAATEKALGLVMAEAQAGKQAGVERKAEVVAALNSIGVSATTSESWDSLISKMAAIIKATGNAVAADVLSGKTFSNAGANNLTGTMANRGAGGTVTPTTTNQTKAAGYYSSAITILGDAKLLPANLPKDITLFGVVGILERMTTAEKQAIANAITDKGIPASVNDSNTVLAQKIGQIDKRQYFKQTQATLSGSGTIDITVPFMPKSISIHAIRNPPGGGTSDYYYILAAAADYPQAPNVRTAIASGIINSSGGQGTGAAPMQLRNSANVNIQPNVALDSNYKLLGAGLTLYEVVFEAWA